MPITIDAAQVEKLAARGLPADVIADFSAQLESLKTGDPAQILGTVQSNLEAIVE